MLDLSGERAGALRVKVQKAKAIQAKALDEIRFLRSWVESPLKTGAVSPSGPKLAARMASYIVPEPHSRVVELGPGTGVVTKALLERGFAAKNLLAIEYSPEFCVLLGKRFPGLSVVEGDAYALRQTLSASHVFFHADLAAGLDGVVSSLPLLTQPDSKRAALLEDAFAILRPGAPFIQFSYSLAPPVKVKSRHVLVSASDWIWKNLPPARVWVYRTR